MKKHKMSIHSVFAADYRPGKLQKKNLGISSFSQKHNNFVKQFTTNRQKYLFTEIAVFTLQKPSSKRYFDNICKFTSDFGHPDRCFFVNKNANSVRFEVYNQWCNFETFSKLLELRTKNSRSRRNNARKRRKLQETIRNKLMFTHGMMAIIAPELLQKKIWSLVFFKLQIFFLK